MSNSTPTRFNFTSDRTEEADWIVSSVINIALFLSTMWVLASLIHHGIKIGKWKNDHSEMLSGGKIYTSLVVLGGFCWLHSLFTLAFLNVGFRPNQDLLCEFLISIVSGSYNCVIFSVMTFLWLRQRVFYSNPVLKIGYSKRLNYFSLSSITFVYLGGIIGFILLRFSSKLHASPRGCMIVFTEREFLIILYFVLIFVSICFGQFTLLGLFIYALKSANQSRTTTEHNSTSPASPHTNNVSTKNGKATSVNLHCTGNVKAHSHQAVPTYRRSPSHNHLTIKDILRKTFIFAVVSVLSDILVVVVAIVSKNIRVTAALYNFNAFILLKFVVYTFANFKQMIFSPCFS